MKTLGLRDIIGPVMVGPSSSHTAGALAIAKMARNLCAQPPARVTFTLYGSFAHTGSGHGTGKALVAGMLGFDACDLEIRDSFSIARDRGLDVEFVRETRRDADHPNTVDIVMEEPDATRLEVRGVSVGGGAAVITRIDGIDVDVTGEHTSVVIRQRDERGVLAHIASCIAERGVNIATTRMYRTRRGATAYTVMETDDAIPPQVRSLIAEHESILDVRVIPAMNRIAASAPALDEASAEERFDAFDFTSGAELIALCAAEKCSIAHAYRMREEALCALDGRGAGIDEYLDRVLSIMEASATEPADAPLRSTGGLIGGEAKALRDAAGDDGSSSLLDALSSDAVAFALAVLETNAAMGRIRAARRIGGRGPRRAPRAGETPRHPTRHATGRSAHRSSRRTPHRTQRQRVRRGGGLSSGGGLCRRHGSRCRRRDDGRHGLASARRRLERVDLPDGAGVRPRRRAGRNTLPEEKRHRGAHRARQRADRARGGCEPRRLRRNRRRHGRGRADASLRAAGKRLRRHRRHPERLRLVRGARITHRGVYTLARSDDGRTRRNGSSESRASRSSRWARNPSEAFWSGRSSRT